jgi:hypothetical protein
MTIVVASKAAHSQTFPVLGLGYTPSILYSRFEDLAPFPLSLKQISFHILGLEHAKKHKGEKKIT